VSGVVNTRQIEELPLNGRNFFDLTLLAKGQTANSTADTPTDSGNRFDYNLNIDGQQVTTQLFRRMNPTFSRDAIAEFEFVANRFDATQGRTHGAQLNVITKSGTNRLAGTFAGYFRDDRFNAADFIQQRVLPYSNQQISGTLGGPIRLNRAHFFGSYEYEREPQILTFDSPYPSFRIDSPRRRASSSGVATLKSPRRCIYRSASRSPTSRSSCRAAGHCSIRRRPTRWSRTCTARSAP
jgi:hypothetical protein